MIESHKTVITGGTAEGPVVAMGGIDASNGGRGVGVNPPVTGPLSKFDRPQIQIFI